MNRFLISTVLALAASVLAFAGENRVAVVISRTSYDTRPLEVDPAAKSWIAACNLAGLPYSSLFVEDLDDRVIAGHKVFVFCCCNYLNREEYSQALEFLSKVKGSECAVVVDGPLGLYDQAEDERDKLPINDLLGIVNGGMQPVGGFRLRVADNDHYITSSYPLDSYLSNLLAAQLPALTLGGGGAEVLVTVSDGLHAFPYETVSSRDGFRLALFGGISNSACVGASFKNYAPKGFFPSELYPLLRKTLLWCVNGDTDKPFPSLLLNGGGMTAFIRVDGDGSQVPASMRMCMSYLEDIARETGVQGVMTYVSAWATRAGWHFYADYSRRLQELGTYIGTHSKNHRLSELKTPKEFSCELDGSKKEIRDNHISRGYDPGEIRYLVNPGNTLEMRHYDEIASRFDLFMSHGYDQSLPVAYGNLGWFTGGKQLAMVQDSPSPDYQWFYDASWSYTTAEVANYEIQVLEHLFKTLGNAVVFNAMWHDYGMSKMLVGEPRNVTKTLREGTRIINGDNREYYEAIRNFWNTHDVYCPEAPELVGKMKLLSNAGLDWLADGDALTVDIVFDAGDFEAYSKYIGGMAVAVNNSDKAISSVEIDGKPWYAFSDEKIILPNLASPSVRVVMRFGGGKPKSRVVYSSKILENVVNTDGALVASVSSKSMARVKFETETPSIVLGASKFAAERGGRVLEGRLLGSGDIKLVPNDTGVTIHSATLPIQDIKSSGGAVMLRVSGNGLHHNSIVVSSPASGHKKVIDIKELKGDKTITIK